YVQYDNDPRDPGIKTDQKATVYNINVWVELCNPLSRDTALTNTGDAILQVVPGYPVYQVVLSRGEPKLKAPENVQGNPLNAFSVVSNYGPNPAKWVVHPSNGQYAGPIGGTQGFYVLGPETEYLPKADPNLPATHLSPAMSYSVDAFKALQRPTILL